jgi:hypothetical protein
MGTEVLVLPMGWGAAWAGAEERDEDVDDEVEVGEGGSGRGKKNASGLRPILSLERRGGWRTLRYMLKERRARLACGTYLNGWMGVIRY